MLLHLFQYTVLKVNVSLQSLIMCFSYFCSLPIIYYSTISSTCSKWFQLNRCHFLLYHNLCWLIMLLFDYFSCNSCWMHFGKNKKTLFRNLFRIRSGFGIISRVLKNWIWEKEISDWLDLAWASKSFWFLLHPNIWNPSPNRTMLIYCITLIECILLKR